MSAQQFGNVGQVQTTETGNIINEGVSLETLEQHREAHRQELCERQNQHLIDRDDAERRSWRNGYALWFIVGSLIVYPLLLSGWFRALPWWCALVAVGVGIGLPALLWQRNRYQCMQHWTYHNEAIGEINRALHTL